MQALCVSVGVEGNAGSVCVSGGKRECRLCVGVEGNAGSVLGQWG